MKLVLDAAGELMSVKYFFPEIIFMWAPYLIRVGNVWVEVLFVQPV